MLGRKAKAKSRAKKPVEVAKEVARLAPVEEAPPVVEVAPAPPLEPVVEPVVEVAPEAEPVEDATVQVPEVAEYRKKPIVISAWRTDKEVEIETLEGVMTASPGDFIITGVRGERYPCKPDIFEATYDNVEDEEEQAAQEKSEDLQLLEDALEKAFRLLRQIQHTAPGMRCALCSCRGIHRKGCELGDFLAE